MTAAVTAAVLCCALIAGCAASGGRDDDGRRASDPSGAGVAPGTVADPAFAESAPGERDPRQSLLPADVLIAAREPLPPALVKTISNLPGVAASTVLSLANVSIENKVYNLAAVDPAVYRRFAPSRSADLQEQWDRVAGGEIAVSPRLRKALPVDADGFLDLAGETTGASDEQQAAARVHVGAWAPQVEQIDLVINRSRAEALGMTLDNAVLISTGQTSPSDLRKPLAAALKSAGEDASVQNLDVVARLGLDPDAFLQAVLVGTIGDAVGAFRYRPIGGGRVAPDPSWVTSHIATETVPILGSVTCNKYLFPQLKAALGEIVTLGLADKIHPGEYAGCYYPRFIAGTTTLSNHAFGLALDINVPGNQRGTVGQMDRGVVAVFKKWGFAWGGDWRYTDPMHFELSRLVRPGG